MEQYHHECRRPRGVYLSIDHADGIEEAFGNLGAGPGDIDLILATDAEQIFGIGDWGVGGIEISIGKLAIYTAAGGMDPRRVVPVMLDVGTNRKSLLADPMYPGNRHVRIRGERYDAFIEAYVKAATKLFPNALLQWEDCGPSNAAPVASSKNIAAISAPSMTIFRARGRSRWQPPFRRCASAERSCAINALLFSGRRGGRGHRHRGSADSRCDAIDGGLPAEEATAAGFGAWTCTGCSRPIMGDGLHRLSALLRRMAAEVEELEGRVGEAAAIRFGRGGSPGAAHHADRRVRSRRRLHGANCERYGPAYRPAHDFPAFESPGAGRGDSSRSDCVD